MDYLYKAIFYKRKYSNLELKKRKKKKKEVGEPKGISRQAGLPGSEPETSRVVGRYVLVKPPLAVLSGHQTPQLTLPADVDSEHCP